MKSSEKELRARGMVSQIDINLLENASDDRLKGLINLGQSFERTAAVVILSQRYGINEIALNLLQRLRVENCLYTKIKICETLAKGDLVTARMMTPYLGKIGHNQHKTPPERHSKKKSYPLPRDIIARTLGKMAPSIFPALADVLQYGEKEAVSEALDAAGYMLFYNPEIATNENAAIIKNTKERFKESDIIKWKVDLCYKSSTKYVVTYYHWFNPPKLKS